MTPPFITERLLIKTRKESNQTKYQIYDMHVPAHKILVIITDTLSSNAQTHQSFPWSHTQGMDVDEDSDCKLDLLPSAWVFKVGFYKTCLKRPLKKRSKIGFKTDYRLMQVKSIAECSNGSILHHFRLLLCNHLSLRSLFCLFLSGCLRQVLL